MKKVVLCLLCIVLVLCFPFSAYAENSVDISISVGEIKNNRLFDMVGYAQSDKLLCAGEFDIIYDSEIIEYRGIESDIYTIKAREGKDKITVVFANSDGVDVSKDTKLFTIKFKCISNGSFDLKLNSKSCLNEDFSELKVTFDNCEISVSGNAVTARSKATKTNKGTSKTIKDKSSVDRVDNKVVATSDALFVGSKDDTAKAVFYGIVAGFSVITLFAVGVICGKHFSNKMKKSNDKN